MRAWRRYWPWIRRLLLAAFFLAVAALLFRHARVIDWSKVWGTLTGYGAGTLAAAIGLALASHLLYASFDLLGRRHAGHRLDTLRTLAIAATSYAFNLNLGAWVGGAGFRFRLYSRFGLRTSTITRVLAFAIVTNWAGYGPLLGVLLVAGLAPVPEQWQLGGTALRAIGVVLVASGVAWVLACAFLRRREWSVRGYSVRLPSWPLAALQILLSACNWMLMAGVIYVLLQGRVEFTAVVAALMLGAVAGAMTHIPAGLGVIEAIFVVTLSDRLPEHELIAALLAYRAIYYLLPLGSGVLLFAGLEGTARKLDGVRSMRDLA